MVRIWSELRPPRLTEQGADLTTALWLAIWGLIAWRLHELLAAAWTLSAAATAVVGLSGNVYVVALAMLVGGYAWMAAFGAFQVAAQLALPRWVGGRGLALVLMALWVGMACGGALWGQLATKTSIATSLLTAAATSLLGLLATWRLRLDGRSDDDLTPSPYRRALQLALGTNDMPLTLTWKQSSGQPDVVRQFNSFGEIGSITDTLARVVTFNYDSFNQLNSITQSWGGQQHTWATFGYGTQVIQTNFPGLTLGGIANGNTVSVLTRVGLANGSTYSFEYNTYGQVKKIRRYAPSSSDPESFPVNSWRQQHFERSGDESVAIGITDLPPRGRAAPGGTASPDGPAPARAHPPSARSNARRPPAKGSRPRLPLMIAPAIHDR